EDLGEALSGYRIADAYEREIRSAREEWDRVHGEILHPRRDGGLLHQAEVIRILNEHVDENGTVVHAAGGLPGDLHKLWRSKASGDYHSEYGYSCMGYEIAGALGVKMARPERDVYAFVGDGSYLMLNHEIVTSVQEGYKITVVLNDNHGYQCIHGLQRSCGSHGFGNQRSASLRGGGGASPRPVRGDHGRPGAATPLDREGSEAAEEASTAEPRRQAGPARHRPPRPGGDGHPRRRPRDGRPLSVSGP